MRCYVELKAWAKAMDLAALVCELCKQMPKNELYGMVGQL